MKKIIIDGTYLQCILKECFGEAKINIRRLADRLGGAETVCSTTYYYPVKKNGGCVVSDFERAREEGKEGFLHALASQKIEVKRTTEVSAYRDGRYQRAWPDLYTQISVDIVRLVFAGRIDELVLLAESASLIPALVAARDEGITVTLWHSPKRTRELDELSRNVDKSSPIDFDLISGLRLSA